MNEYLDYTGLATLVEKTKDSVKNWVGVDETSGSVRKYLNERGEFADAVVDPAVPDGSAGIISYTTIQLDEISSS